MDLVLVSKISWLERPVVGVRMVLRGFRYSPVGDRTVAISCENGKEGDLRNTDQRDPRGSLGSKCGSR